MVDNGPEEGLPERSESRADAAAGGSGLIARTRAAPMDEPIAASGLIANVTGLQLVAISALMPENPTQEALAAQARPMPILGFALDQALFDARASAFAWPA